MKKLLVIALMAAGLLSSCGTMDDVYVTSYPWYWNRPYYSTEWYHPTPPPMVIFHKAPRTKVDKPKNHR